MFALICFLEVRKKGFGIPGSGRDCHGDDIKIIMVRRWSVKQTSSKDIYITRLDKRQTTGDWNVKEAP